MGELGFFRVEVLTLQASSDLVNKSFPMVQSDYADGIVYHKSVPLSMNLYSLLGMDIMVADRMRYPVVDRLMKLGILKDEPAILLSPIGQGNDYILDHSYLDFVEGLDDLTSGYALEDRGINYSFITGDYGIKSRQ